jgi:hypothetical protein
VKSSTRQRIIENQPQPVDPKEVLVTTKLERDAKEIEEKALERERQLAEKRKKEIEILRQSRMEYLKRKEEERNSKKELEKKQLQEQLELDKRTREIEELEKQRKREKNKVIQSTLTEQIVSSFSLFFVPK